MNMEESRNLRIIRFVLWLYFITVCVTSSSKNKNDLSLHQYTESGEVAQMLYASRAIDKSSTGLLGFSGGAFSVLFAIQSKPSSLQVLTKSKYIIEEYSKAVGVAMCGYAADNESTRSKCNLLKQMHILKFGETPLIDNIAKTMSRWLTRGMYIGEEDAVLRPIATAILLFGRDRSDRSHRLVLVENSGFVKECSFVSVGTIPGGPSTIKTVEEKVQSAQNFKCDESAFVDVNLKKELKRVITDVVRMICDAADGTEGDIKGVEKSYGDTEIGTSEIEAEKRGVVNIECSISCSGSIFSSGTFSSPEKFLRLINGWQKED